MAFPFRPERVRLQAPAPVNGVRPVRLPVFAILETVRRERLVADHAPAAAGGTAPGSSGFILISC
ncbi:hypothetical protein GCM10011419_00700 [Vogesella fluminis]|uniref:Uncharacterized protein n=1 Tax=Vogesella fluminis TaxID=1069161 RepID=A0ABQ3H4M0_9NEIS|nr:hypothetical protein GCM10011419_00700 [Vogesella fluminis]